MDNSPASGVRSDSPSVCRPHAHLGLMKSNDSSDTRLVASPDPSIDSPMDVLDSLADLSSPSSPTTPSSPSKRQHWRWAAKKGRRTCDPWAAFEMEENCATEAALRYRYNAKLRTWATDDITVKLQLQPFAHGALRNCYRMKKLSAFVHQNDWKHASNYVAKSYKKMADRRSYFDDVQLQMDAKLWAEEYNKRDPPKKVDMFQTAVIELSDRQDKPLYCIERFIEGDYIKYNSNSGFVSSECRHTPQAFSHFTFERSGHRLIVVDVQGVGDLYTDPQIHTEDGLQYGIANLGTKGMALFFNSHRCNPICKTLCLTPFDLSKRELEKQEVVFTESVDGTVVRDKEIEPSDRKRRLSPIETLDDLGFGDAPLHPALLIKNPAVAPRSVIPSTSEADTETEDEQMKRKRRHRRMRPASVGQTMNPKLSLDERDAESLLLLGQVHYDLALCHEAGRFSEDVPNVEDGLFHLQKAAQAGVLEAGLTLAKLFLQLPQNQFPAFSVPDTDRHRDKGLALMRLVAVSGCREAIIYMARNCDSKGPDLWMEAVDWYEKAVECEEDAGDSGIVIDPKYNLLARVAEIYMIGGGNMDQDMQRAGELYTEAAELAMESMKGKLANKYYALAEEAWAAAE